jgi:tRNA (adenine22-N1)-methyltransferase
MININKRLKTIGDLVDSHSFVLDVGCDHGLLEVYLLKKKINIVGSDNKQGPLDNARKNYKNNHVKGELRLGDGLDALKDEDTVIISGMGGLNIISILRKDIKKTKSVDTYILSPNNYVEAVRRYLSKLGYHIDDEVLVKDKFIYNVIVFKKGKKFYRNKDYYFGPVLLKKKDKLFYEYYNRELDNALVIKKLLPKKQRYRRYLINKKIKKIESELE